MQGVPQVKNWGRTAAVVVSPGKRMQQRLLSYLHLLVKSMATSKEMDPKKKTLFRSHEWDANLNTNYAFYNF